MKKITHFGLALLVCAFAVPVVRATNLDKQTWPIIVAPASSTQLVITMNEDSDVDTTVYLSSNSSNVLVPSSIVVPQGQSVGYAGMTILNSNRVASGSATVTASANGHSASTTIYFD